MKASGMPVTESEVRERFNAIAAEEGDYYQYIPHVTVLAADYGHCDSTGDVAEGCPGIHRAGQYVCGHGQREHVASAGLGGERHGKARQCCAGVIRFFKEDARAVVTVKAGTVIQTERINGRVYELATTDDVVISGTASALLPVKATGTGGAYNLAPGYYRILPVAVDGISHVVSEENWLTVPGADEESDGELRERCRNQFNLVGNYHTDAVYRSMIAGVVGLSIDRIFFEHDAPRRTRYRKRVFVAGQWGGFRAVCECGE